jgi:hypothetical protein
MGTAGRCPQGARSGPLPCGLPLACTATFDDEPPMPLETSSPTGFRLPRLLLPRPGIDLRKWAVIACDQYTSEPAYWRRVAEEVGDAPSTLHLIYPEVYLEAPDKPARIEAIQRAMRRYLAENLFVEHAGAVYVERRLGSRVRRGLMLELDLECYDYSAQSTSLIRPTEGTMVERLAPRIAVRSGAELELPHILVLVDDAEGTVIEPLAASRDALAPLYETELMLGGGRVAGFAVDGKRGEQVVRALQALADPRACARRYGLPEGTPPMLFAMGDGNHSLATAKSIWAQIKAAVGVDHPSRWALVEVVNIHDPALDFAPIHRLLFGVKVDVRTALRQQFGDKVTFTDVPTGEAMRARLRELPAVRQAAGLIGPGAHFAVAEFNDPPSSLAVGTLQPFVDCLVEDGAAANVDYVHGDETLERLAQQAGCLGFHIGTVGKSELLRRVVREGPLPRKTFSMGEADEKRFYVEARRIR